MAMTPPDNCPAGSTLGPDSFMQIGSKPGETKTSDLTNWILRRLGAPTHPVEITTDQLWDCVQEALIKWVSVSERPVKYWQFQTTPGRNTYPLPDDFVGMHGFELYYIPNSIIEYIQTFTSYQMYVNFTGNLDITLFETMMENLQLKVNRIGANFTWEILSSPPRIKIYPAPYQIQAVVFSYVSLPRMEEWTPSYDLVGFDWTRRYALAKAKEVLGRVRSRYGDSVTMGDNSVTQDGNTLLGESKEEIQKLEDELDSQRQPMGFWVW